MISRENVRFGVVVLLLAAAGLFVHGRSRVEKVPASAPVVSFAPAIGDWQGTDLEISDTTRQVLGSGDFLSRRYTSQSQAPIDLFLAYFPTQTAGQTIHSPKNCLPGSGWMPVESTKMSVAAAGGRKVLVNRYVLGKGPAREIVLYWYQAHARIVASEYWAKVYLVLDAARMNRTDGALVRISTPVLPTESQQEAEGRAVRFAEQVIPRLDAVIPL